MILFRNLSLAFCLTLSAGVLAPPASGAIDQGSEADEELLKDEQVGTKTEDLLAFLHLRSPDDPSPERVDRLLRLLASDRFRQREQASRDLVRLSKFAVNQLRTAAAGRDVEVAKRAKDCLQQMARETGLSQAVVRLLRKRRSMEAVPILLQYLPFAEDEQTEVEVYYALEGLGVTDGKIHLALRQALRDKDPARRAVAGCLVGWRGSKAERASVRNLLRDSSPLVRLRAAQGLLASRDSAGLQALIALLEEPDVTLSWQAEELLHWVAGASAPRETVGAAGTEERRRCRAAWETWHRVSAAKVDLVVRHKDVVRPGLLLVCDQREHSRTGGYVWLRGCDGKPRWRWWGERGILDAWLLPTNRLLMVDGSLDSNAPELRVREVKAQLLRTIPGHASFASPSFKGVLFLSYRGNWSAAWQLDALGRKMVSRTDGDACLQLKQGNKTITPDEPPRYRGGRRIAWVNDQEGLLVEADVVANRILRHARLSSFWPFELLPNGNWLLNIELSGSYRLAEVNCAGKIVWQCRTSASSAARLPNGNTIVAYGSSVPPNKTQFAELDRVGRKIWEATSPRLVSRFRVCLPLVRFGFDQSGGALVDLDSLAYRIKGLKDKDPHVRRRSANWLGLLGREAEGAVPDLFDALDGLDNAGIRDLESVLRTLVGPKSLPVILRAAKDRRPIIRCTAIDLFSKFRDRPQAVVPTLLDALNDESAQVRRRAASTAGSFVDDPRIAQALVKALHDKDPLRDPKERSVREYAAFSLGRADHKIAIPALFEAVKRGDHRLLDEAVHALGRIAHNEASAVPVVVNGLVALMRNNRRADSDRASAASALGLIGPRAKAALPALREALRGPKQLDPKGMYNLRDIAISVLGDLGPEAKNAVPDLLAILQDKKDTLRDRVKAAEALAAIGKPAKEAILLLQRIEDDSTQDDSLRSAAGTAINVLRHLDYVPKPLPKKGLGM